jgi:hypothetical protein
MSKTGRITYKYNRLMDTLETEKNASIEKSRHEPLITQKQTTSSTTVSIDKKHETLNTSTRKPNVVLSFINKFNNHKRGESEDRNKHSFSSLMRSSRDFESQESLRSSLCNTPRDRSINKEKEKQKLLSQLAVFKKRVCKEKSGVKGNVVSKTVAIKKDISQNREASSNRLDRSKRGDRSDRVDRGNRSDRVDRNDREEKSLRINDKMDIIPNKEADTVYYKSKIQTIMNEIRHKVSDLIIFRFNKKSRIEGYLYIIASGH